MAAPSAQTLQRIAAETRLPAATLEKVLRLLDVLQAIAEDRDLKTRVALKGGTALNVFHLRLDRLSVDIDLNYVGAVDRAAMEADRPLVDEALLRLLEAQGYQVRRQPPGHAGGKWVARYGSALGGGASIEVDLNYMARGPLFGVQTMTSTPLGGMVSATGISVLDLHEVVAGKLVALLDRRAARDLFDARRILETQTLDWSLVRVGVLAWGAAGRRDWREASLDDIGGDPRELKTEARHLPAPRLFRDRRRRGPLDRRLGCHLPRRPGAAVRANRRRSGVSGSPARCRRDRSHRLGGFRRGQGARRGHAHVGLEGAERPRPSPNALSPLAQHKRTAVSGRFVSQYTARHAPKLLFWLM